MSTGVAHRQLAGAVVVWAGGGESEVVVADVAAPGAAAAIVERNLAGRLQPEG